MKPAMSEDQSVIFGDTSQATSPQDQGSGMAADQDTIFGTPQDVTKAESVGKDLNAPNYNGLCLQFVDDVLQTPAENRKPTASAAWQDYAQTGRGIQGTQGMQPGDIIFFDDPNNPEGHVGIYSGGNKFVSATGQDPNQVVKNQSIAGWQDITGDSVLGYVKNPSNLPQIGGTNGN